MRKKTNPQKNPNLLKKRKSVKALSAGFGQQFLADGQAIAEVIIAYAIELGVKELHFEWQESRLKLRWRLAGKLVELFSFDGLQSALVREQIINKFALEINHKLPFVERTVEHKAGKQVFFLSLSAMPIEGGDRFFLRIDKAENYDLARLDLNQVQKQCLNDLFTAEGGIIAVGAVKTLDRQKILKSLAGQYAGKDERIVLISEQPLHDWSVGEILTVKPEIGFTRLVAIRSALQTDFDYILLDFVSRPEEMELILELAERGKKILLALPWSSPSKNFHYLWQLTADKTALRRLAKGLIVEYSLPKLCKHCRQAQKLSAQGRAAIEQALADLPASLVKTLAVPDLSKRQFYQAKGCFLCKEAGFQGVETIYSAVKFKKPSRVLPLNFNYHDLLAKQNFISLRQVAIMKASEGHVDLLDALSFIY